MSKLITLLKAFRVNENTVRVLYLENKSRYEFVVEWNNIHPNTGEETDYDIQMDCLSNSEALNEKVCNAISGGGSDENEDADLYLEIIEKFNSTDCIHTE